MIIFNEKLKNKQNDLDILIELIDRINTDNYKKIYYNTLIKINVLFKNIILYNSSLNIINNCIITNTNFQYLLTGQRTIYITDFLLDNNGYYLHDNKIIIDNFLKTSKTFLINYKTIDIDNNKNLHNLMVVYSNLKNIIEVFYSIME